MGYCLREVWPHVQLSPVCCPVGSKAMVKIRRNPMHAKFQKGKHEALGKKTQEKAGKVGRQMDWRELQNLACGIRMESPVDPDHTVTQTTVTKVLQQQLQQQQQRRFLKLFMKFAPPLLCHYISDRFFWNCAATAREEMLTIKTNQHYDKLNYHQATHFFKDTLT